MFNFLFIFFHIKKAFFFKLNNKQNQLEKCSTKHIAMINTYKCVFVYIYIYAVMNWTNFIVNLTNGYGSTRTSKLVHKKLHSTVFVYNNLLIISTSRYVWFHTRHIYHKVKSCCSYLIAIIKKCYSSFFTVNYF